MRSLRWFAFVLLWSTGLALAQPDYFPLDAGNQWVYRCTGACGASATLTLEITRAETVNGRRYSVLHGWGNQDYRLRRTDAGTIVAWDPETGQDLLWYAFQFPEGQPYKESLPSCCGTAAVVSRETAYSGPVGEFGNALEIRYPGVFQVGIFRELFLPYVGLVHRGEGRGGPAVATYDLIYARLGGVTVISQPELAFGLALDRSVYPLVSIPEADPPTLTARLTLRNTQSEPVAMVFNSSQMYDLVIRDANGTEVYRWSRGMAFAQVITEASFGPGEKNWLITVPLGGKFGSLAPGKYVAEGWLTPADGKRYGAMVGFELR